MDFFRVLVVASTSRLVPPLNSTTLFVVSFTFHKLIMTFYECVVTSYINVRFDTASGKLVKAFKCGHTFCSTRV